MHNLSNSDRSITFYLEGEIDHCTAQKIREEIEAILSDQEIVHLILDFSLVTFMDSSGVGMLIGRYKTMKQRNGRITAIGLSPQMERLFRLGGLHRIIEIQHREEHAANE